MVFCHNRSVPSSLPLAYNSPSGEYRKQCTAPKCPENESVIYNLYKINDFE